jgi:hypothetical protein
LEGFDAIFGLKAIAVKLLIATTCGRSWTVAGADGGGFGGRLVTGFGAGCSEFNTELTSAADTITFAVSSPVGRVCWGAATMPGEQEGGFGTGLESGPAGASLELTAGLKSALGTTSPEASRPAGNVGKGATTIAGADGSRFGGRQASLSPTFELGSAVLAGCGGWGSGDDGGRLGYRSEECLPASLAAAEGTKALAASLLVGKLCGGVP